ncbi:MAG: NADH-quinone oxidoreductase subunit L [Armatimonadetes bacterium]|nr:NADH-quinone oxidoreductase subunit L [Armatimonadota bacterium]
MPELLWLIPGLPMTGFALLALWGSRLPRVAVSLVGVGSVALSAALSVAVAVSFLASPPADHAYSLTLWQWLGIGGLQADIAFRVDPLALLMMLVITIVGALIHLYSTEYMARDEDYSRFFAYMNLFVGAMLTLVMADNLLLLYLGWEGVGLCSYLLIGFWYRDPANGKAAMKAFIVTRVGDAALAVGLFVLYTQLGTLNLEELAARAPAAWPVGSALAVLTAALLLGGAVGKSAQLPLQTWLPDAMAGPTPVSALIHAATMVTAGVYLIARTHAIFALAPTVLLVVAVVGVVTLFLAAVSALAQWDLKRVLAYSTISQIGYMFLALGVGAWSAAMFHFMTHAFFKALLFLAAGAIIMAMHEDHSIFRMGGLRHRMPLVFWTFLAGACSLSALPLVTAGFYSKDEILAAVWAADGGQWLWVMGLVGAFLTAVYSFRVVYLVFFGEAQKEPAHQPGWRMAVPLAVLAVLALVGGALNLPRSLGNLLLLDHFLEPVFAGLAQHRELTVAQEIHLQLIADVAALGGILVAWLLYRRYRADLAAVADLAVVRNLRTYWLNGWGFDWLYDRLVVRPYESLARLNRADAVDYLVHALARFVAETHRILSRTQTGEVRWYVAVLTCGVVILVAIMVLR